MNPISHAIWWMRIGIAVGRQDHKRVVELSNRVLKNNPNHIGALGLAANHLEALGDLDAAKDYAQKALAIDPDDFDLHCLMIRRLDEKKDKVAMLEHAKCLVLIAATSLSQSNLQFEKVVNTTGRIPFNQKMLQSAKNEMADSLHYQKSYLQWAKKYIASQDERSAQPIHQHGLAR